MEPNSNPNRFYILSGLWTGTLSLLALVIGIIVGLAAHRFDVTFAFIITLVFPSFVVFISMKVTNGVINFAKSGGTKKQIILVSMLLFVIKYLVLVIPLIAGLLVNIGTNTIIFNPFALVIGILIYPTTTLIVQWYFVRDNRKEKKQK